MSHFFPAKDIARFKGGPVVADMLMLSMQTATEPSPARTIKNATDITRTMQAAILQNALLQLFDPIQARAELAGSHYGTATLCDGRDYTEAVAWFHQPHQGYVFDFLEICEDLQFTPENILKRVRGIEAQRKRVTREALAHAGAAIRWGKAQKTKQEKARSVRRGFVYLGDERAKLLEPWLEDAKQTWAEKLPDVRERAGQGARGEKQIARAWSTYLSSCRREWHRQHRIDE